jgi:hypothetical protein
MKKEEDVFRRLRDLRREVVAQRKTPKMMQDMKAIIYNNSLSMTPCHARSSKCTSGGGLSPL